MIQDFLTSFNRAYKALTPQQKNFFLQHFLGEIESAKKDTNSNFMDDFIQEFKEIGLQNSNAEDKNFIEEFIANAQEYLKNSQTQQEQEQESQKTMQQDLENAQKIDDNKEQKNKQSAIFVLPLGFNYFNQIVEKRIQSLKTQYSDTLKSYGYGEDETNLFSPKVMNELKAEYAQSYFTALNKILPDLELTFVELNKEGGLILESKNPNGLNQSTFLEYVNKNTPKSTDLNMEWLKRMSIENVQRLNKNNLYLETNFIETLEQEVKEQLPLQQHKENNHSQSDSSSNEKTNTATNTANANANDENYASLSDWFDKIKIEHKNFKLTKQDFKERFFRYCQNNMNEDEMKILLILANKTPSKLTKEHQEMIKNGLEAANTNSKLMDRGLQICIKAQIGYKLEAQEQQEFKQYLQTHQNSADPINQKLSQVFATSTNKHIVDNLKPEQQNNQQTAQNTHKR